MLVNISLIPFLLAVHANVSKESDFDLEYLYELNKTSIAYREPSQITELTSTLICHSFLRTFTLRCFLHDIMFVTTLKYENFNVTKEITREKFKVKQWFEMHFNKAGVVSALLRHDDRMIANLIKHIISQFNIGSEVSISMLHPRYNPSGYSTKEITPIGTCRDTCNMEVSWVKRNINEETNNKFQIKPMSQHFVNQTNLRINIVKNRTNCNYSQDFADFLNGMEVAHYTHTMEVVVDKLKILTIMDGQLPPDPWNPSGTPVFKEITQLNLIDIRSKKTMSFDNSYKLSIHRFEQYIKSKDTENTYFI